MYDFKNICKESMIIVDNLVAGSDDFLSLVEENLEFLRENHVKFFIHNSFTAWTTSAIFYFDQNNLSINFGSEDISYLQRDILSMIIANCDKSKVTLFTRNSRLSNSAKNIKHLKTIRPKGVEVLVVDSDNQVQDFSSLTKNSPFI